MKSNIGSVDKTVRIVIAALVLVLYLTNIIPGRLAITLFVVAAILLLTVFINFCPIWHFLGISTKKKNTLNNKKN